jgi:hypothetical protein
VHEFTDETDPKALSVATHDKMVRLQTRRLEDLEHLAM